MKIKLPKTDRLLGVSAMIISVLTLIIFIYQTNIINRQSKLSVKPRLSFSQIQSVNDSIVTIQQVIINKGLGPAIIKKSKIIFENKSYPLDFDEFIFKEYSDVEEYGDLIFTSSILEYTTISPNETSTIYKFQVPQSKVPKIIEYFGLDSLNVDTKWQFYVEYTSMYEDQTWKINSITNKPVEK